MNVETPEKVVTIVKRFLREYPATDKLIRIGHGSIITRNRIITTSLIVPLFSKNFKKASFYAFGCSAFTFNILDN